MFKVQIGGRAEPVFEVPESSLAKTEEPVLAELPIPPVLCLCIGIERPVDPGSDTEVEALGALVQRRVSQAHHPLFFGVIADWAYRAPVDVRVGQVLFRIEAADEEIDLSFGVWQVDLDAAPEDRFEFLVFGPLEIDRYRAIGCRCLVVGSCISEKAVEPPGRGADGLVEVVIDPVDQGVVQRPRRAAGVDDIFDLF